MLCVSGVSAAIAVVPEARRARPRRRGSIGVDDLDDAAGAAAAGRAAALPRLISTSNGRGGLRARQPSSTGVSCHCGASAADLVRHEAAIGEGPQQLIELLQLGGIVEPDEHALPGQIGLLGDAAGDLQRAPRGSVPGST